MGIIMNHETKLILIIPILLLVVSQNASAFLPLTPGTIIIQNQNTYTSSNQGTYNKTLANNVLVNSQGNRINFINSTNNPIHVVNDPTRNQVNITIADTTGAGAVTSVNALTGALNIVGVAGNTTVTSAVTTITVNTAYNVVTTGLSPQTITKALTLNQLILGGDEDVGSNALSNAGHKSTLPTTSGTLCQSNQSSTCGAADGITSINGDGTGAQTISAGQGITVGNAGATHTVSTNFKVNNITCGANTFFNSYNNATGIYNCGSPTATGVVSLNFTTSSDFDFNILPRSLAWMTLDGQVFNTHLKPAIMASNLTSTVTANHQYTGSNLLFENPAKTFDTALTGGAVTANRTLNLPAITGTDTLGALGLAQSWSAKNTFTGNVDFTDAGTAIYSFDSSGPVIRNPAKTFGTTIANSAITANRTLNLPLITGTDTLGALNTAETWTGNQQFTTTSALFENAAKTFATTLAGGAQTANRTINMPVTIQTETMAIKPVINFTASSNKTGTTTFTMLGDGVTLTPTVTGRASITVSGYTSNSVAADGGAIQIRQVTGGCPANAAAVTGTALGSNVKIWDKVSTASSAGSLYPFSITVQTTGLTINQKYCFELTQQAITGGTFTVFNVMWAAEEI